MVAVWARVHYWVRVGLVLVVLLGLLVRVRVSRLSQSWCLG